jgi:hypothetical protein
LTRQYFLLVFTLARTDIQAITSAVKVFTGADRCCHGSSLTEKSSIFIWKIHEKLTLVLPRFLAFLGRPAVAQSTVTLLTWWMLATGPRLAQRNRQHARQRHHGRLVLVQE